MSTGRIIHIHAKCEMFETFENICESKCISRLLAIKRAFQWYQKRGGSMEPGILKVNTVLVNPTLF